MTGNYSEEMGAVAQSTIQENPIVSIAATAGLGLILGALMARR